MGEFADCDRVFGVDAALVDPFLDFVEVYGDEVGGPAISKSVRIEIDSEGEERTN